MIVLFFAHALVLGVCGLAAATVVLGRTRSPLRTLRAMLPSLLALPPLFLWQMLWPRDDAIAHETVWSWPGLSRVLALPSVVLGPGPDVAGKLFAAGAAALAVMALATFAWTGVVAWRFAAFDADARAFERVSAHLPPGASLMKLVLDPYEPRIPGWQRNYLHVPMWYHVAHGGRPGYQFAEYPHELFQFRSRPAWAVPPSADWNPGQDSYGWISHARDYRWYVARVSDPVDVELLQHGLPPVRTVARDGRWVLFEQTADSGIPARADAAADAVAAER